MTHRRAGCSSAKSPSKGQFGSGCGRHQQGQAREPRAMERHKVGIAAGIGFDRAEPPQPRRVARRPGEFGKPLQRHQAERPIKRRHRFSSTTNPAVNPGPSAVINARFHCGISASIRSSTNITVGADMLP